MYPAITIGTLALPTKPLLLLANLYFILWLGSRRATALGIPEDLVWNWGFLSVLGGLVLGRLAYAAQYPEAYLASPLSLLALRLSAFVPEVAVIGGLLIGLGYLWRHRVSLGVFVDALAPALAVGWAIVALANFLAGDAYGAVTDVPWAVELWGARRHPVQLYEMVVALVTAGWLWKRPAPRGQGLGGWRLAFAYGLSRLVLEAWRGDSVVLPGGWRVAQLVALGLVLIALWGMARAAPPATELTGENAPKEG